MEQHSISPKLSKLARRKRVKASSFAFAELRYTVKPDGTLPKTARRAHELLEEWGACLWASWQAPTYHAAYSPLRGTENGGTHTVELWRFRLRPGKTQADHGALLGARSMRFAYGREIRKQLQFGRDMRFGIGLSKREAPIPSAQLVRQREALKPARPAPDWHLLLLDWLIALEEARLIRASQLNPQERSMSALEEIARNVKPGAALVRKCLADLYSAYWQDREWKREAMIGGELAARRAEASEIHRQWLDGEVSEEEVPILEARLRELAAREEWLLSYSTKRAERIEARKAMALDRAAEREEREEEARLGLAFVAQGSEATALPSPFTEILPPLGSAYYWRGPELVMVPCNCPSYGPAIEAPRRE